MKQPKIILTVAAALVALVAVTGIAMITLAADNASGTGTNSGTTTENAQPPKPEFWGRRGQNLTDEQKAQIQANIDEMNTKRQAVQTALVQKDYNAWVSAVQSISPDAPILSKINADNFSQLANAYSLQSQARGIMDGLGISRGDMGFGGCGGGHGFMGGPHGPKFNPDNDTTAS